MLAESEQMRREADDTGPMAELEHWRQLTAKFNAILEQIKHPRCKMVINILHIAKSKVLKVGTVLEWKYVSHARKLFSCGFLLPAVNLFARSIDL